MRNTPSTLQTRLPLSLACAAALALPAYALTNESFRPIEHRIHLEGRDASSSFELASQESLFFELEVIVRAPTDARGGIAISLNDTEVAKLQVERLYVMQRARLLVPLDAVRKGENRLRANVGETPSATFDMTLRVHNYYGISPQLPRASVVSDEAVAHFYRQRPLTRHALWFAMFYAASLIVVWAIARAFERRSAAAAYVLMLCPSFLLWCAVLYGIATPLHLWLPMETLFAMALAPCVAAAAALWIAAHRRAAARTVAAAMVTIVSFEIALRVFNYFNPTAIFYTDSYSRYRGRPGAPLMDSHLNSRGFNDVEHDLSKPSHVYRIAAIGDSVAFGVVPYRANYLTLLETELAADRPVEVINLGVPGTEPKDYLAILLQEALAFTPDLVMVGFFIGNDFESAARKPHEHSYVATYLYFLWRLWSVGTPAMVRFDSSADSYDDHAASLSSDRFLEIEVERAWIYSQAEPVLQNALTRTVGYLRDIRDISQRAGANVLVVLIPDEVQVDDGLQEQVARAHGSTRDRFDFHLPNRLLAMALAKEGIPFLDLLPAFAEAGQHTRLYKPRDTHWNLAGNRLAAATIAGFLREHRPGVPPLTK
jgi:hypothetical protein